MDHIFIIDRGGSARFAKINFVADAEAIVFHASLLFEEAVLVINSKRDGQWQRPLRLALGEDSGEEVRIEVLRRDRGFTVSVDGVPRLSFLPAELPVPASLSVTTEGAARDLTLSRGLLRQWRFTAKSSGFTAEVNGRLPRNAGLKPGLSFIIRAKNEAHNIERCLRSLDGIADEIVFVDNNSRDDTFLIASSLRRELFSLRTHQYLRDIPRAGRPHMDEVLAGGNNTLGHFYNYCLARSGRYNFTKWDADYIALRPHLEEMIQRFQLRTRGDNVCCWFSGLELYTDGQRYWVDTDSAHNEFRVFSRRHHAHWVNILPWEEVDQRYLYTAHKLFFDKPVYLELFRLDAVEFRDRGQFIDDRRDNERMAYIRRFQENGEVPAHFLEVSGPDDPRLLDLPVCPREQEGARYFAEHFNALPPLHARRDERPATPGQKLPGAPLLVAIVSCEKNLDRQNAIRQTWLQDLRRGHVSHVFVIGRPGQPTQWVGDTLYLDCPDSYEYLASKVQALCRYVIEHTGFSHLCKLDDDTVVNPERLLAAPYDEFHYLGGGVAGGQGTSFDWHAGKCENPQLHDIPYESPDRGHWYGGQFGYFLDRPAMQAVVEAGEAMRRSLYEDVAVAHILRVAGLAPAIASHPRFRSFKYSDAGRSASRDWAVVCDIPEIEQMIELYEEASAHPAWTELSAHLDTEYRVRLDWMNFEAVRARLQASADPTASGAAG
ncbi:MAG TPA: glycosyltransferase [Nevskiaceae bacterium]|nr:glycosyltransferase [Nevskiaceae bacterium]